MDNDKRNIIKEEVVVKLLKDLVSIYSPYFKEEKIMNFVHDWLKEKDIDANYFNYVDEKVTKFEGMNVIGELKAGQKGPRILLNGHLDTVTKVEGWDTEPTEPLIKDGKMYGIGALDMKSGVAALMIALDVFNKTYTDFKGSIIYSFVSDEEGPYGLGTNFLIHEGVINDADVAIVPEPSAGFTGEDFPCLCLGARGGYSYKVRLKGKAAHAANPDEGISAIVDAGKVILELKKLKLKEVEFLGRGDICVLDIKGGGAAASVAESAEFTVFRHIVTGENKETIKAEVDEAVKKANIKSSYEVVFREAPTPNSDGFLPYLVEEDNHYTKEFIKSIKNVTDKETKIAYFSSIGDFNYLGSRLKIPTFVFGAGGKNYHSANEYVEIKDVVKTSQIIFDYLERLLIK